MRMFDFSSWQSIGVTLIGLVLVTLIGVSIRLVVMMTVQQRRERTNRQINERLKTLIAAYKVLGGSFTGDLSVDPRHLRDMKMRLPKRRLVRRWICRRQMTIPSKLAVRNDQGVSATLSRLRCQISSC